MKDLCPLIVDADDSRRWENGYRFIAVRFNEMTDEISSLKRLVVDLRETIQEISVDKPNGKG